MATSGRPEPMRKRRNRDVSGGRHNAGADRDHVNQHGQPKSKMSRRHAQAVAARFGGHAYRCPRCRSWHVARGPKP